MFNEVRKIDVVGQYVYSPQKHEEHKDVFFRFAAAKVAPDGLNRGTLQAFGSCQGCDIGVIRNEEDGHESK